MVNSPREQGENKSGKSRPKRQILRKRLKNKSIVPVSYLLEAIQLQKEEEEKKSGNRQWQKSECYKNDDNMKGNLNRYAKVLKEKNTVMSILFWELP